MAGMLISMVTISVSAPNTPHFSAASVNILAEATNSHELLAAVLVRWSWNVYPGYLTLSMAGSQTQQY